MVEGVKDSGTKMLNLNNETIEASQATAVQANTVTDSRNKYLTFVRNNNCKQGLNSLSNRLG